MKELKMSNELSKNVAPQLPAHMQNEEVMGTERLDRYVRPPRLKIVQKMSKAPFTSYAPGTLMIVPQMMVFASCEHGQTEGELFSFTPIFFYDEWIQTNPLGMEPFVRARSTDPSSELAQKARNSETWFEPHPDNPEKQMANRECLNFIIMPDVNHPLHGTPLVMTFAKANYKDGSNLASIIKMRRAPIFGQVFEGRTVERNNAKGEWFGIDMLTPDNPFVEDEALYGMYKELHLSLAAAHEEGNIQVDYADPTEGDNELAAETAF